MAASAIMIQGTGSNVGKSLVAAGLCRYFSNAGLTVLPFKPQNMSNNAAVTPEGGEIGRAQALQAMACRIPASIHMNPVLLKPETDVGAQIIVQGQRYGTMRAREYGRYKSELLPKVLESFEILQQRADLVIVEGAGSPAEINLRQGDIANMGFAEAADLPVLLVGDIDRGGIIASLVGTHAVLEPAEKARIRGFMINRFRGDPSLFDSGLEEIQKRTGWKSTGVLPWFDKASLLPAEDALGLADGRSRAEGSMKVVVPVISRIANFDDLDPLRMEPGIDLVLVNAGEALPGDADLVLLPGTKSTIGDLAYFRAQGWDVDLHAHVRRGGRVLGICGGLQMLGRSIADPEGIEGPPGTIKGLGHLDIETVLVKEKTVTAAKGQHLASGEALSGYEIHLGKSTGPDCDRPFARLNGTVDGAVSRNGQIAGTYLHGLFAADGFRRTLMEDHPAGRAIDYEQTVEDTIEALATHMSEHLDLDGILGIARAKAS
ncbi:MAG: cobyric acid synthase [Stappiaceae bacterium]